ncbi:MAG: DUF4291 domain-containing protein [Actinomycetaceae bacterium]|nr:DUF4291 domain-containing protein [Actinomycetaceae bacterium]
MTATPNSTNAPTATPWRQVRAVYDAESVTVYQAYSSAIADAALAAGRFVPPFKRERMTWIKPSFLWMMYRSGWATKKGQERVLAVRLSRGGFEEALARSCLSAFDPRFHPDRQAWEALKENSPVRIQWDPERDVALNPLGHRSIQIGIGPPAVDDYVDRWTISITDITETVAALRSASAIVPGSLPSERPYPLPPELAARTRATASPSATMTT